jgi:hypothetical protein
LHGADAKEATYATTEDIAEALGLTSQAIYYRLRRNNIGGERRKPGRPRRTGPS